MSVRTKATAHCVICGGEDVEQNHVGGRHHVAWFTMPFCLDHHAQFHALLRASGVDLKYTPDPRERILRALQAITVCEWILHEALRKVNPPEITNGRASQKGGTIHNDHI